MNLTQRFAIALLRITLGVIFLMHGYLAAAVLGPGGIAGYTTRMGYPQAFAPWLAWYLIVAHLAGGVLLILGLLTRWAAVAQVPIMASALFLYHLPQGFFMKGIAIAGGTIAGGYEYTLLVLVATIAIALLGAGALALDRGKR